MLPALQKGREVVTNMALNMEVMEEHGYDRLITFCEFKPEDFAELLENHKGALVVIDEAWKIWRAGEQFKSVPKDQASFMLEERHHVGKNGKPIEIILQAQSPKKLPTWITEELHYIYYTEDLSGIGMPGLYNMEVYGGNVMKPANKVKTIGPKKYEKDTIGTFYKSQSKSELPDEIADEKVEDNRANIWTKPLIKYGLPLSIISFPFFVWLSISQVKGLADQEGLSLNENEEQTEEVSDDQTILPSLKTPSPNPAPQEGQNIQPRIEQAVYTPPPEPPYSKNFRISGYYSDGNFKMYLITNGIYSISLPESSCNKARYSCVWQGETVTKWTGLDEEKGMLQLNLPNTENRKIN